MSIVIPSDAELERQIDAYAQGLRVLSKNATPLETTVGFDVVQLSDWPSVGKTTFTTCGLCGFLLPVRDREEIVAHELAIPFLDKPSPAGVVALLEYVADSVLERRYPISDGEAFALPPEVQGALPVSGSGAYCRVGSELSKGLSAFISAVRVEIVELALLRGDDLILAREKPREFQRAFVTGGVKVLNLESI